MRAYSDGIWEPLTPTFARLVRRLTGPSKVMLDHEIINYVASLTAYSLHGYEVTINCEATYYKRIFHRWYMPKRTMAVYEISSIVRHDAPERLRDIAGQFVVTMPRECMYWLGERYQKQQAIEAYLDLLLAKLERRVRDPDE
jgi:hypothetical protein